MSGRRSRVRRLASRFLMLRRAGAGSIAGLLLCLLGFLCLLGPAAAAPQVGNPDPGVTSWRAMAYSAVGSAAVRVHREATAADTAAVDRALSFLERHPEHGLRRVLRGEAARDAGAFPGAYAVLTAEPDVVIVGVAVTGDIDRTKLLLEPRSQGQHGHEPDLRAMEAVLIVAGPGIRSGATIPTAEVLDLAPVVARVLGLDGFGDPGAPWTSLTGRPSDG